MLAQIMKKNILILLLLISITSFSSESRYFEYKYANVTVVIETSGYVDEVNNVKIIGQYAEMISNELKYSKPIHLIFNHDYTYTLKGKKYISISFEQNKAEGNLKHNSLKRKSSNEVLTISQFGNNFSIKETLKLINFGIKKINTIKENIQSVRREVIDSVRLSKSLIVSKIVERKVYVLPNEKKTDEKNFSVTYFSQNGKYILIDNRNRIIDTLEQITFCNSAGNIAKYVVILENNEQIKIYAKDFHSDKYFSSGRFNTKIIDKFKYLSGIRLTILNSDILLIEFYDMSGIFNDLKMLYLKGDNKLITNFVDYVNSYRRGD